MKMAEMKMAEIKMVNEKEDQNGSNDRRDDV